MRQSPECHAGFFSIGSMIRRRPRGWPSAIQRHRGHPTSLAFLQGTGSSARAGVSIKLRLGDVIPVSGVGGRKHDHARPPPEYIAWANENGQADLGAKAGAGFRPALERSRVAPGPAEFVSAHPASSPKAAAGPSA